MRKQALWILVIALAVAAAPVAQAQINSNTGTITLNAALTESLTVTVNSGNNINFNLLPNTAVNAPTGATTTSNITTAWTLKPGRTAVAVWAYFGSAASALVHQTAGNTVDIPSSAVSIQVGGAGAFTPLTAVSPFNAAASGAQIGPSISITGLNKRSSRTDTLAYNIDTTVVPQLPADTYVGTLNIQAQATP